MGVKQGFQDMRRFEVRIGHASLVLGDMMQDRSFLGIRKERGGHRGVRKEDDGDEANQHCETAEKDEHDPPAGKGGVDLLKSVADDTTNDLTDAQAAVPKAEAWCLL